MTGTMLPDVFLSFLNICNNLLNYLYKSDYAWLFHSDLTYACCMNRHSHKKS